MTVNRTRLRRRYAKLRRYEDRCVQLVGGRGFQPLMAAHRAARRVLRRRRSSAAMVSWWIDDDDGE